MSWWGMLGETFRTLQLWQWGLLLAVPPAIFALYFLKLKRQPQAVPSTFLWQRTIEDLHVNSLWQRLRQSLLLLLQILFALLLLLAAFNPTWQSSEISEDRYIFVVDNSASMSATDVEPSRLEAAKESVRKLVEQMDRDDVAMIISTADRAKIEQAFTRDKQLLLKRLDAVGPTQRPSNLEEALQIADGLANPARSSWDATDQQSAAPQPASVYIYSDGGFRSVPKTALGHLEPFYVPIGEETCQNVAISAFEAAHPLNAPDQINIFARIQNYGSQPQAVIATLYLSDLNGTNERIMDAQQLALDAEGAGGVQFDVTNVSAGRLRLQLEVDDDLAVDNQAFAVVNPPRRRNVLLVTPGFEPLTAFFAAPRVAELAEVKIVRPGFLEEKDFQQQAVLGAYDLVIFDRCQSQQMPQANTLSIGAIPIAADWKVGSRVVAPQVIDIARTHPLMNYVDLLRLPIFEATIPEMPTGGQVLADSVDGPLIAIAPRGAYEDAVVAFPLLTTDESDGTEFVNTDWPTRFSFPLFLSNALDYLGGSDSDPEAYLLAPGSLVKMRWPTAVESVNVTTPRGANLQASRSIEESFVFGSTEQLGIYVAQPQSDTESTPYLFAINLFDSTESDIRPRELIETQYESIEATRVIEPTRREFWRYALVIGLLVMLFEWYVYNRRVYL